MLKSLQLHQLEDCSYVDIESISNNKVLVLTENIFKRPSKTWKIHNSQFNRDIYSVSTSTSLLIYLI